MGGEGAGAREAIGPGLELNPEGRRSCSYPFALRLPELYMDGCLRWLGSLAVWGARMEVWNG